MENKRDNIEEKRLVNLVADHDKVIELIIQHSNLAEINADHELRLRSTEKQIIEWHGELKGYVKVFGVVIFLFT